MHIFSREVHYYLNLAWKSVILIHKKQKRCLNFTQPAGFTLVPNTSACLSWFDLALFSVIQDNPNPLHLHTSLYSSSLSSPFFSLFLPSQPLSPGLHLPCRFPIVLVIPIIWPPLEILTCPIKAHFFSLTFHWQIPVTCNLY